MSEAMQQTFGLIRRPWGVFYVKKKATGVQKSLKTSDKVEAVRLLVAMNEATRQPAMNLSLARVYLRHSDPPVSTRTWQHVMAEIIKTKSGENQVR